MPQRGVPMIISKDMVSPYSKPCWGRLNGKRYGSVASLASICSPFLLKSCTIKQMYARPVSLKPSLLGGAVQECIRF